MVINSSASKYRVPLDVQGIQVNCCKNPNCINFGIPAGQIGIRGQLGPYAKVGAAKGYPVLRCNGCQQHIPMKSNQGVFEELTRISAYLNPPEPSCPNETCPNHTIGVSAGQHHYYAYGTTKSGSPRFKCRECDKIFTASKSTLRQRITHRNKDIFKFLVNKMPFARICDVCEITMSTLYGKIDLLHRQALAFVQEREADMFKDSGLERLYIATDRQEYTVNWSSRSDRRNLRLTAVGSSDLTTGYVFGMHLNFAPHLDAEAIEADAHQIGDAAIAYPFRKYAHLWLSSDYADAVRATIKRRQAKASGIKSSGLDGKIAGKYADASAREDVEVSDEFDSWTSFPKKGMQTRLEYTLYAHFLFLKRMFQGVDKVRFYLDQESGIRAAFMSAFGDKVKAKLADAFYVSINKTLTVPKKQEALKNSRDKFKQERKANPSLNDDELIIKMIVDQISQAHAIGQYQDLWVDHPFPNMSEPEKKVCHLTDIGQYSDEHLASMYIKASLHPIDRFFMLVRRRLSLLERPASSSSNAGRKWHSYSPYNPEMVVKLLDIFRVYYNYCLAGKDGKTPAMRLGLAKAPIREEDIIYFDKGLEHPTMVRAKPRVA